MPDLLSLKYIPISQAELFDHTAKLHNLDQIIQSIARGGLGRCRGNFRISWGQ
jgi:hypothetical protein